MLPTPYDFTTIFNGVADGAPVQNINMATGKAILKFDRADIMVLPLDIHFDVIGTFMYNGGVCRFVGSDSIMKVHTEECRTVTATGRPRKPMRRTARSK